MHCSSPPSLTSDQISMVIDGIAEAPVLEHIQQCPSCATRVAQAQHVERTLQSMLYRVDCPSPQRLGEYHLGLVDQTTERTIIRHLEQCRLCITELEDLRIFLTAQTQAAPKPVPQPAAPRPKRRFGEIVARLLPPQLATQPALRGNAAGPIMAEAKDAMIVLDVRAADKEQVVLTGQIVADDQDHWTGALVELHQYGMLKAMLIVDDLGSWSHTISAGITDIRVTPINGQAIVLEDIELTGDQ